MRNGEGKVVKGIRFLLGINKLKLIFVWFRRENRTRGLHLKIIKINCKLDVRKYLKYNHA